MRQELLAVLAKPVGPPPLPKKRGEGKKTERGLGLAQHEVLVPKPVPGGTPVAVMAARNQEAAGNTLGMSLAACGFQAWMASEAEPWQAFGALLVVADGRARGRCAAASVRTGRASGAAGVDS